MEEQKEVEVNLLGQAFVSLNPILYFFSVKDDVAIIGKSARAGKVAVSFRLTELFDENITEPVGADLDLSLKVFELLGSAFW